MSRRYGRGVDPALEVALELLAAAPLVTGRYGKFNPDLGVPIRSTVGYPRFWRHGPLVHAKEITPYGVFGNRELDDSAQRIAYLARLQDLAVPAVEFLAGVARQHPGQRLVVCCFEDVHAGEECHRRWFADWFESRYGIAVPEL
jgi:hypothetical protein